MSGGLHVSASALRLLQDCPRAWNYRYLAGHPAEDVGPALVLGKACHAALALWFERLRDGLPEATIEEMIAIAVATIDEARGGPTPLTTDEDDETDLVVEAARMLRAYMATPLRPAKVLGVEMPFSLDAREMGRHPITGEPYTFEETVSGVFDLVIEEDGGGIAIIDHKICKMRPVVCGGLDLQLAIYALAAEELFRPSGPVRLLHHLLVRTKTPKVELREVPRSTHDVAEALEAVASGVELIHVAVGHPRPGRLLGRHRSWRCGGCGYRSRCAGDRT